jgi:hypothetical protein
MTASGLSAVQDPAERAALRAVTDAVAQATFERWLSLRTADDNRVEHEFVVFGAAMRIAEAERLSLSGKLVVVCATFLHDTYPIARITETAIRECLKKDPRLAAELVEKKASQRIEHMQGGAQNAGELLRELPIVSGDVRDRCAAIIAGHDYWKLGKPHPPSDDREALVCFEADALWPLHPLGVLADLERSGKDVNDPAEWRKQIGQNLRTLSEYRANWQNSDEVFQDAHTIFRTAEGHRLYREWAGLWAG